MKRMPHTLTAMAIGIGLTMALPSAIQAQAPSPTLEKASATPTSLRVMKDVIGQKIVSLEGKEVGQVEDLAVDSNNGRVAYVVLERTDKSRLLPVPFQLLRVQDDRLMLTVAHDKLESKRGFKKNEWPDMHSTSWARDIHKEFGVTPYWELPRTQPQTTGTVDKTDDTAKKASNEKAQTGPQFNSRTQWVNRASQMIGIPLKSTDGKDLGKVQDLFLDVRQGRGHIVYAIVTGTPDLQNKMALVPFAILQPIPQGKEFRTTATADDLAIASLTEADFDRTEDPQWHRRVHQAFQREPYWTTFGIPSDDASDDRDQAWQPGSTYMNNFDLRNLRSFTGSVVSLSDFKAADGVTGKQMVITSDEDQRKYTIHLGPAQYFEGTDAKLTIKPGDHVTVLGSRGLFEGKELYLAIRFGKLQQLRDSSGKGQWDKISSEQSKPAKDEDRD